MKFTDSGVNDVHSGELNGAPNRGAPNPGDSNGSAPNGSAPSGCASQHDIEARSHDQQHEALRLWLRLLASSLLIEKRVRRGLRTEFNTTLPRFDLMAQLERSADGLKMGELSRRMMVTGGNVTSITDQLVSEGMVARVAVSGDRRASMVRLTETGRTEFNLMAKRHEEWIVECFSGLDAVQISQMYQQLGRLKRGLV